MEVIRIENVSKLYDLGQVGTGTISKDLNRWWASLRGKEDPYARLGQVNDRTKKSSVGDTVWALKDINISINQGDVVGLIGRNGAGKSTLLKIISQITTPSTGAIKLRGRIASLLEVGTGFHPEMTGRENIFMNGTLLGMTRREIQKKFDEIVDFAGVELYIDTPVKRYSSGMQVRLAFAVAAFLEPEILIVDEVLAVGDAEFQKKAIGRMQEVSSGSGRTVVFVSHNMLSIQKLCTKATLLSNGQVEMSGDTQEVVNAYINANLKLDQVWHNTSRKMGVPARMIKAYTANNDLTPQSVFLFGEPIKLVVELGVSHLTRHFIAAAGLKTADDYNLRTVWSAPTTVVEGTYKIVFNFDDLILASGAYFVSLGTTSFEKVVEYFEGVLSFTVSEASVGHIDKRVLRHSGVGAILNPIEVDFIQ